MPFFCQYIGEEGIFMENSGPPLIISIVFVVQNRYHLLLHMLNMSVVYDVFELIWVALEIV